MDELLSRFVQAQQAATARVHAVTDAQWTAPTPDRDWSVADLVDHLVDEQRWVGPLLHGLDLEAAGQVVAGTRELPVDGGVGANLAEAWDEAVVGATDAVIAPGALERQVALSRGPTPARDYLDELVFDLVVHSWDLQRATGFTATLPGELVEYAVARAEQAGDLAASGLFDAPRAVAADAPPLDRLIARTGRDPGWRP